MLSCQYYGTGHTPSTHFGPAGPGPRPERLARRLTRPWALFYIPAAVALSGREGSLVHSRGASMSRLALDVALATEVRERFGTPC